MYPLRKTKGPECPVCGCTDTEQAGKATGHWWNPEPASAAAAGLEPIRQAPHRCRHCGHTWIAELEPVDDHDDPTPAAVPYVPVRCPACRAKAKTHTTRGRVRYHKCEQCGLNFKSIEQ